MQKLKSKGFLIITFCLCLFGIGGYIWYKKSCCSSASTVKSSLKSKAKPVKKAAKKAIKKNTKKPSRK